MTVIGQHKYRFGLAYVYFTAAAKTTKAGAAAILGFEATFDEYYYTTRQHLPVLHPIPPSPTLHSSWSPGSCLPCFSSL